MSDPQIYGWLIFGLLGWGVFAMWAYERGKTVGTERQHLSKETLDCFEATVRKVLAEREEAALSLKAKADLYAAVQKDSPLANLWTASDVLGPALEKKKRRPAKRSKRK